MDINPKRARFEASVETKALIDILLTVPVGDLISYGALNEAAGKDVQREASGSLATARRAALSEGIAFSVVRGDGLRHLSDIDASATADSFPLKIRRMGRRALKLMSGVKDYVALSSDEKKKFDVRQAGIGVHILCATPKIQKKIEAAVSATPAKIDSEKLLKLFAGK